MRSKKIQFSILTGIVVTAISPPLFADTWALKATPGVTSGSYSGSQQRDKISDVGLMISGDYLEQGGVTVGYSNTQVNMKNASAIKQDNYVVSGRMNYFPDGLTGRLTLRLDGYQVNNNDATGNTNNVTALAPQISWLSTDGMLYADLGYAKTHYQNQLNVSQLTPTIGFGLNGGADWIQLRSYLISGLNPVRAANKSSTTALDANWTHYFEPGTTLAPSTMSLGFSTGEKVYAVDMDAQSVSNLADLSKGGATVGLGWKVAKDTKLFVLAGQTKYSDVTLNNNYKLNVGYANLTIGW
ncbi:MAG: hypothetical protein WC736_16100 [Gallionella sp.]|jgi:hypothetical protein